MQHITRNDYITTVVNAFTVRTAHFEMTLCGGEALSCEVGYLALLNRRQLINNAHYGRDFLPAKAVIDARSVARGLHISAFLLLFHLDQLQGTATRLPFPKRYLLTTDSLGLAPKSTKALADGDIFFLGDVANSPSAELGAALSRAQYTLLAERMRDKGLAVGTTDGWPRELPMAFHPLPQLRKDQHPLHDLPIARTELRQYLTRRLASEGYQTLGDLMTAGPRRLSFRPNIGKVALCRIETLLAGYGIRAERLAYSAPDTSLGDAHCHPLMAALAAGGPGVC